MNRKVSSAQKPKHTTTIWETDDLREWQKVCNFGSDLLLAKGDHRRLVDPTTGEIKMQYEIPRIDTEGNKDD